MAVRNNGALCIGCKACEQACQDIHNLPAGKRLMEIVQRESVENNVPQVRYELKTCLQCGDAPCLRNCPVGAIEMGGGAVRIRREVCVGCGICAKCCPQGAVVMIDGGPVKCDMCGVCAAACPMGCITIIDVPINSLIFEK